MRLLLLVLCLTAFGCAPTLSPYATPGFTVGPVDTTLHIDASCPQMQDFLDGNSLGPLMIPAECIE